jgi:hypothetical protein
MTMQLDLFGAAPMVSRWPGDGPFASKVWRDDGDGTAIRTWFDGTCQCQMHCAPCARCGVWHPLDFEWGTGGDGLREGAWRCPHGAGWAAPLGIQPERLSA